MEHESSNFASGIEPEVHRGLGSARHSPVPWRGLLVTSMLCIAQFSQKEQAQLLKFAKIVFLVVKPRLSYLGTNFI
ncbi:hypothetical protein PspLS_10402 [Pyricularia sp. CBS 133598]|nr:hypothetical protein PspLS_10402 [Pyricularia sp. CBS 133598]